MTGIDYLGQWEMELIGVRVLIATRASIFFFFFFFWRQIIRAEEKRVHLCSFAEDLRINSFRLILGISKEHTIFPRTNLVDMTSLGSNIF